MLCLVWLFLCACAERNKSPNPNRKHFAILYELFQLELYTGAETSQPESNNTNNTNKNTTTIREKEK